MSQIQIALFASGAGTNAQNLIDYFRKDAGVTIKMIAGNNVTAGVVGIATRESIPLLLLEKKRFDLDGYLSEFTQQNIDLIILAGFLWKIPPVLIQQYPGRIINIHPALLPAFGGKGMYGMNVHTAVINSNSKESGITIHQVDEIYDHGSIIFQARCTIEPSDTPESLATKIHALEYAYYPEVIDSFINTTFPGRNEKSKITVK